MMNWLLKWNRGRHNPRFDDPCLKDPRLGLRYRTEPSHDEKSHAFENFYKGWHDYIEDQPAFAPPNWPEADRQWYHSGYEEAQTERPAKEPAATG